MPALPLPIVMALFLALLAARLGRRAERDRHGLVAFVVACAIQAIVVGLRWGYDVPLAGLAQPVSASVLPGLAWLGFVGLGHRAAWRRRTIGLHALPVILVAALACWWRAPIDLVLAALFAGYGAALIGLARPGFLAGSDIRFGAEGAASGAAMIVGGLLLASAATDLLVAADFSFAGGLHAAMIVGVANLATLTVTACAALVAEGTRPRREPVPDALSEGAPSPGPADAAPSDADVLVAVDALMRDRRLYLDPDLTLDRLARRAGIPARLISGAVNRARGRNVSQVVNDYRIAEAQRLLAQTTAPVTAVMLDAGFQTKSNFNREFRRVTGMTPSAYRRATIPEPEARPATVPRPGTA